MRGCLLGRAGVTDYPGPHLSVEPQTVSQAGQ